ncbi:MAG: FprA family A-type flavoprotein [Candidatus Thorarchaeota archaeon]
MHREMTKGVYFVGVDDHHTELFENLWDIPFGVSYNSYLIVDEKIAVVEGVKALFADEWLENIRELVDPSKIDYIIVNHMEPDHTGSLPDIARVAPNAKLVYTSVAAGMQKSFFDVGLEEMIVEDLQELSLGTKTLQFIHAKFLHWPETMMTYIKEDEILFSCDAFGAFGALNGLHFDDEINMEIIEWEAKRYVGTIITAYFKFVQAAIKKVKELNLGCKMIAPSHGPIYRKNPMWIVNKYDEWSGPELEKVCTIVWGTMYGFTTRIAMNLKKELENLGVEVKMFNVSYTGLSRIITETVRAGVIVLGAPTYDAFPFPKMWHIVDEIQGKRYPKRPIGIFGTYGWQGGGVEKMVQQLRDARYEILEPIVHVKARPTDEQIEKCKSLAKVIAEHLK